MHRCAQVEIEGFPSLVFFPAGGKESVPMEDERTLAGMTSELRALCLADPPCMPACVICSVAARVIAVY